MPQIEITYFIFLCLSFLRMQPSDHGKVLLLTFKVQVLRHNMYVPAVHSVEVDRCSLVSQLNIPKSMHICSIHSTKNIHKQQSFKLR